MNTHAASRCALVYVGIVDPFLQLREGEEAKKALCFYPQGTEADVVANVGGLAEAIGTFASVFSPSEGGGAVAMEAEMQRHIFYTIGGEEGKRGTQGAGTSHEVPADDDGLLCFMVVSGEVSGAPTLALRELLIDAVHSLRAVHGCLRLFSRGRGGDNDQHNTIALSNSLVALVPQMEVTALAMSNGMDAGEGRQVVPEVWRSDAIKGSVQRVIYELLAESNAISTLALYKGKEIWSTFHAMKDASFVFRLAEGTLSPAAGKHGWTSTSGINQVEIGTSSRETDPAPSTSNSPFRLFSPRRPANDQEEDHQSMLRLSEEEERMWSPLQALCWRRCHDGGLMKLLRTSSSENKYPLPEIRLPSGRNVRLLVYSVDGYMIILTMSCDGITSPSEGDLYHADVAALSAGRKSVEKLRWIFEQNSSPQKDTHVTGYRYFYKHEGTGIAVSSPQTKVAKMSKDVLGTVRHMREIFSHRVSQDLEVFLRTKGDAWIILRRIGTRELWVALERAGETLLEAAEAIQFFTTKFFPGMKLSS